MKWILLVFLLLSCKDRMNDEVDFYCVSENLTFVNPYYCMEQCDEACVVIPDQMWGKLEQPPPPVWKCEGEEDILYLDEDLCKEKCTTKCE